MPILDFGTTSGLLNCRTQLSLVSLARALCVNRRSASSIKMNISLIGRVRSPDQSLICRMIGSSDVDVKRSAKLGTAQGSTQIKTLIQYFINAMPIATPEGRLLRSTVAQVVNAAAAPPAFGGHRFTRGDSVNLSFTLKGERLDGFNTYFTACRLDETVGSPHDINKAGPGSIRQTGVVRDSNTGLEIMTGSFTINPADTTALPDGEYQYIYKFWVDDGNGRVHTLESGNFKVFSVC